MIIDFHSHILPGMDDGAKTPSDSLAMLRASAEQGVEIQFLTPHFYPWADDIASFTERRSESLRTLRAVFHAPWPVLIPGAEVAFFPNMSRADLTPLCLGESRLLLIEMPFAPWDDRVTDELASLVLDRDYQVILAHVERYCSIRGNAQRLLALAELPLTMQINAEAFFPHPMRKKILRLADSLEALVLGSDAHNGGSRAPNLRRGRELLEEKLGAHKLRRVDEIGEALVQSIKRDNHE